MDIIGVAMGVVTIPMALLSIAAILAMLWLALAGGGTLVGIAIAAFVVGVALALLFERIAILFDGQAWATLKRSGRGAGMLVGVFGASLPMIALLAWQYASFIGIAQGGEDHPVARWLLSYGVATGPWTLLAMRIGGDRRTLCGIRAYAGHLGYWLFSILAIGFGVPGDVAVWAMPMPAILPLIVGALLAVADRDSLRNVRI